MKNHMHAFRHFSGSGVGNVVYQFLNHNDFVIVECKYFTTPRYEYYLPILLMNCH